MVADWIYHSLIIAVIAASLWFFLPKVRPQHSPAVNAEPIPLSPQEQRFLNLLQQIVPHHPIEVHNKRFLLYSSTHQLLAIFIYRHEAPSLREKRQERGVPVFIYKGQFSEDDLRWDITTLTPPPPEQPSAY